MSKITDSSASDVVEGGETKELAKIEPTQVIPSEVSSHQESTHEHSSEIKQNSLMASTRSFLRQHGVRKSVAAVRDAVEMPHDSFSPSEAVSALSNLGFKSSFGRLKFKQITPDLFPLIAFLKNGEAIVLQALSDDGTHLSTDPSGKGKFVSLDTNDFLKEYSGFIILAKELNAREKEERSGHWFFSAFRKSKWLYVQVLIAAMVSNFLSLSTSLFTMTVYDRIIPNGAFESLMALSIGVVIALGFDFLIKSLRSKFIDIASKRAD